MLLSRRSSACQLFPTRETPAPLRAQAKAKAQGAHCLEDGEAMAGFEYLDPLEVGPASMRRGEHEEDREA